MEKTKALEALADVRELSQRILDANPHSIQLVHAHRLIKDAYDAAEKKSWLRCWRYANNAAPVFFEQDYTEVGSKLVVILDRLFIVCQPPEYS